MWGRISAVVFLCSGLGQAVAQTPQASVPAPFRAASVSATQVGNGSVAWFIGTDGGARLCVYINTPPPHQPPNCMQVSLPGP